MSVTDHEAVDSQEALRQRLQQRGIKVTQAIISRDLKYLGLVRRAGDGAYVRPGASPGQGPVAEELRRAELPDVAGTIGVDDTILSVCRAGSAEELDRQLKSMMNG